jgi:hypothetical protein
MEGENVDRGGRRRRGRGTRRRDQATDDQSGGTLQCYGTQVLFHLLRENLFLRMVNFFIPIVRAQISARSSHALAGQFNATEKKSARHSSHRKERAANA